MGDWQPIETAPKDGTDVLLACAVTGWVSQGYWLSSWYLDQNGACWLDANLDEEYGVPLKPTHWQPLPPPPKEAKDE